MPPIGKPGYPDRKNAFKSMDKDRHAEDHRHHPLTAPAVHQPHHPQKKEELPARHHPHTGPENKELDIDHGTHADRPRPGKLAKKEEPAISLKSPRKKK